VKHSVTYIPLVHVYAVLFNTGDFYCGNLYKEENEEKGRKNFVIGFPLFQFLCNRACLKVAGGRHSLYLL
jgi:hypothetical protein